MSTIYDVVAVKVFRVNSTGLICLASPATHFAQREYYIRKMSDVRRAQKLGAGQAVFLPTPEILYYISASSIDGRNLPYQASKPAK